MGVFRIMYYWCQTLRAAEKQRGPACLATAPCCGLLPGVTVDNVVSNNWKDSIVKGGVASHTLDKLEIHRDGPRTVLYSSHVDLSHILLRC